MENTYYKQEIRRKAGRLRVVKFVRVDSKGSFTVVDTTRVLIKSTGSFGGIPRGDIVKITKEEFDQAVQEVLKKLLS